MLLEREACVAFAKGRYWTAFINFYAAFMHRDMIRCKKRTPLLKATMLAQAMTSDDSDLLADVIGQSGNTPDVPKMTELLRIWQGQSLETFEEAARSQEFAPAWTGLEDFSGRFLAFGRSNAK